MILGKKVRLKSTKAQELVMWKSVGTARWIYNWTLARQQENYKQGYKFISDNELRKEITEMKQLEEFKWLFDVSNNVAKQAVKDACDAYKNFFQGKAEFPRFKSRKHSRLSFYNDTEKLKVKPNKRVLIEKVGWMQTSEQIPVGVKYCNPRVSFDGKYWYLSVGIERKFKKEELTDEIIGIDLGITTLAVCSNGNKVKNINKTTEVRKIEKRLRRLQRSVSRKYEMNKEGDRYAKTSNCIKIEKQNTTPTQTIGKYPYQSYSPSNERNRENQALQSCDGRFECERDDEKSSPVQSDSTAKVQGILPPNEI